MNHILLDAIFLAFALVCLVYALRIRSKPGLQLRNRGPEQPQGATYPILRSPYFLGLVIIFVASSILSFVADIFRQMHASVSLYLSGAALILGAVAMPVVLYMLYESRGAGR